MSAALAARLAEPDLAALPDWQAAEALNAPDPALPRKRVDVLTADAHAVLLTTGEWASIVIACEPSPDVPVLIRGACINLRGLIETRTVVRMSVPAHYAAAAQALGGLVAAGILSAATRDALLAMAEAPQSWAEVHGVAVTATTVGQVRGAVG